MAWHFEPPSVALFSPPTVAGDLIVGRADGNFDRLAIGSAGQILSVVGGAITWGEGPLTTLGDVLVGATAAAPTRLGIGSAGQILSVVGGVPAWGEGPLTTLGDLLIGATGAAPSRLAIGANGTFLNVSGGAIRWGNTIDTGGLTITAGGLTINGSPTGYTGELKFSDTGVGSLLGISTFSTGSPRMFFDHRAVANTGDWKWRNGTGGGGLDAMFLSATGLLTVAGGLTITTGNLVVTGGGITHNNATLLTTTTALTNNAGVAAGTLTNAPNAGNPLKWVVINDNGTARSIPTW